MDKAIEKSPVQEKDDKEFEEYFDKDSKKVPPYTINFADLSGLDAKICRFMADYLVMHKNMGKSIDYSGREKTAPANLVKHMFSDGIAMDVLLENLEVQEKSATIQAKNSMDEVAQLSRIRDEALMHYVQRRAAYILSRTPFFGEQNHRHSSISYLDVYDSSELAKQLQEKPYSREPERVVGKGAEMVSPEATLELRQARKYLYDNVSENDKLYEKGRVVLDNVYCQFKKGGIKDATRYLNWKLSRTNHETLRDFCTYVRDKCMHMEKILTRELFPDSIKNAKDENRIFADKKLLLIRKNIPWVFFLMKMMECLCNKMRCSLYEPIFS